MTRSALFVLVTALLAAACGGTTADPPPAGGAGLGAPAPGQQLTVPQAVSSDVGGPAAGAADPGHDAVDASGPLLVQGALLVEGEHVRLCEFLMESLPPQCGGEALAVQGLDLSTFDLQRQGEHAWLDVTVSLLGTVADGGLTVDSHAAG